MGLLDRARHGLSSPQAGLQAAKQAKALEREAETSTKGEGKAPQPTFWQKYRKQVWIDINKPKVYKFMCWVMIFCYPAIARKSFTV